MTTLFSNSRFPSDLLLAIAVGLIGLAGCRPAPKANKSVEKVSIVATVHPLADMARQVGGQFVDVSWVIEMGQSISGVELSSDMRNRLRNADLVLMNGVTEPWAPETLGSAFQPDHILRLDALNYTATETPEGQRIGYLWLDPIIVANASRELCQRLLALRPQYDRQLRAQTETYASKLESLVAEYRPKFAAAQNKRVLVLGPEFSRMLNRFGLLAIPTVDVSPMRLSDADLKIIKQIAHDSGTRLLVVSADVPSAVATDLEIRGGLQMIRIDSLGSSGSGGRNTYLQLMQFDVEQLLNATSVR